MVEGQPATVPRIGATRKAFQGYCHGGRTTSHSTPDWRNSQSFPGILPWWKDNQPQYPGLGQLAKLSRDTAMVEGQPATVPRITVPRIGATSKAFQGYCHGGRTTSHSTPDWRNSQSFPGILPWWKDNQPQYPGLAQLAKLSRDTAMVEGQPATVPRIGATGKAFQGCCHGGRTTSHSTPDWHNWQSFPGILPWWKDNQPQYPGLAQLAKLSRDAAMVEGQPATVPRIGATGKAFHGYCYGGRTTSHSRPDWCNWQSVFCVFMRQALLLNVTLVWQEVL